MGGWGAAHPGGKIRPYGCGRVENVNKLKIPGDSERKFVYTVLDQDFGILGAEATVTASW